MVNKKCQVFTPDIYAEELLDSIDYKGKTILGKLFLENSAGEGHILTLAVERYLQSAAKEKLSPKHIKYGLEHDFLAFEIDKEIVKKCIKNLDLITAKHGVTGVKWNIINQNYLTYSKQIEADYIAGNPPYITYQEIDENERIFIRDEFESCSQGKFDYCYAFIEKSIKDLKNSNGKMAYFIPSSIFKNAFGKKLREILLPNLIKISDYKHRRVFLPALISPAVIVIDKSNSSSNFSYMDKDLNKEITIVKKYLKDKWVFSDHYPQEEVKEKFGDYFDVSNSVATLLNNVFVFKDSKISVDIEQEILREAASPRGKTYDKSEKIIFPYRYNKNNELVRYTDQEFRKKFPLATEYLLKNSEKLEQRKADGSWFEYGRSQALTKINQEKLLLSSVITGPIKAYKLSKNTIPYSGFFITKKSKYPLSLAYDILNSNEFHDYIMMQAINASGKSVRISVNDIKSFGFDDYLRCENEN